jgi:hypothetical protein
LLLHALLNNTPQFLSPQAVFQVQSVMARSLVTGTWRKTKLTKLLRHAVRSAALADTTVSDSEMESNPHHHPYTGQRLDDLPEDIAPNSFVLALTAFHPHTSCSLQSSKREQASQPAPSRVAREAQGSSDQSGDLDDSDEFDDECSGEDDAKQEPAAVTLDDDDDEDEDDSSAEDPSSGADVNPKLSLRTKINRSSISSKSLALHFQPEYEREGCCWTEKELRPKVLKLDPGARKLVCKVLRRLRDMHTISGEDSVQIIQGTTIALQDRGWGVCLHESDAQGVRAQVLQASKKLFHARMKNPAMRSRLGRKRLPKFSMRKVEALLEGIDDVVYQYPSPNINGNGKRGLDDEPYKQRYLMGYTAIPPNIMEDGDSFSPVDSLDCATAYSGVMVVRAKKNANNNIAIASVSRLLGPEGNVTVKAHCAAEKAIMGAHNIFSRPENLTITDGGAALRTERHKAYPLSQQMACATHFRRECLRKHTTKAENATYERLLRIPKNQVWRRCGDHSLHFLYHQHWHHPQPQHASNRCRLLSIYTQRCRRTATFVLAVRRKRCSRSS